MSSEARPISTAEFSQAIEDLPVENLYSKAHEIQNSVAHLQKSNDQLQEYSDSIKNDTTIEESVRSEGDRDCLEAIRENEIVIKRQLERIDLLKKEVERRGGRWHEGDMNPKAATNGVNGHTEATVEAPTPPASRPRLTDDELRRRLQEQMDEDTTEEEGMHL